ncbi:serine hydrolase domain-containing protein [Nonomuraea angiospora]|uniref:serine hydrolase domain-containing protein n=1 Tax=Nonomuraea angiospora TaxID=46172 RepID=UPI0029B0DA66|nr:serine hydrolase domain-containing protein [Nonomuraea angiospora]MDX3108046.1 serine hydrolase [Nonomuraea angiospora]
MSQLQQRMAALVDEAGYRRDEPIVVGMQHGDRPPILLAQGLTLTGEPLGAATLAYTASLSKQMTAACAAQLAQQGELDMESTLSRWLPQLPAWANAVRLRHLVHHTAGMPADAKIEALMDRDADRTTEGIIRALAQFPALDGEPGAEHAYSNAGYVCLAAVVERALGQPLPGFARRQLFTPLAMVNTRYWTGPDPAPPGAAPLVSPHPAPLSLGDGGVWSTAADLLRWGQALNADELGISALIQTPGRLDDGTPIAYAWGIGVRSHAGYRVYRHGGGWQGLRALHARVPELDLSMVLIAIADHTERRVDLLNSLLDEMTSRGFTNSMD